MSNSSVAFIILIIASVCALSSASDADDQKAWLLNFKNASQFTCKEPQPRAILAETLLKDSVGPGVKIWPAYTVLHRCDEQSGCCLVRNNEACSVGGTKAVQLTFKLDGISGKSFKTVTAYNHTRCICLPRNEQPKRFHWLEVIPVQLEIASGQSTQSGYNLILLGCVICLFLVTIFIYII